ncbi:hypothetical protein QYE76_052557 [Lolium multiflorum]|uniref:Transposase (putative) gypsy type domain-containing protein n=1 Tax=Lolium multiflorum TaxID=4521 RepID=A0AAD8SVU0_LOLMU|nr:hypothetical protein QYE76_052557 [Lolium multiflorum]
MRSTNLVPSAYKYPPSTPEPPFTPFLPLCEAPPRASSPPCRNLAGTSPELLHRRTEFVLFLTSASHRAETPSPATPATADSITVYGLQPHNISPNSVLAISNHVTLCEGHLRVPPELSLFQYYFSVKKEKVRQSTELATCGSITFMIRPGRVYPHRPPRIRGAVRGFFYLKDVSDPASTEICRRSRTTRPRAPAWSLSPSLRLAHSHAR